MGGRIERRLGLRVFRRGLPFRTAFFYWRAVRVARDDPWASHVMTHEDDFVHIVGTLAKGRRRVVEVGTGCGTTAIGLALADPSCEVSTYDPFFAQDRVAPYVGLARRAARRVSFLMEPGESPSNPPDSVDLVFIDGSHERAATVAAFRAWEPHVVVGGLVAFHDFNPVNWPGVVEAVREDLNLEGEIVGYDLFVWRKQHGTPTST